MQIDLRHIIRALMACSILYLLAVCLCGCAPSKYATQKQINKAEFYFPELLYQWCSKNAKETRDSTTTLDTSFTPANNENYQAIIDSLLWISSQQMPDVIVIDTCKQIVQPYQKKISDLNGIIATLKAKYKPCVPDTVLINSKTKVINDLTADKKLKEIENEKQKQHISELEAKNAEQKETIKSKNIWIAATIALSLILAALTYLGWRRR